MVLCCLNFWAPFPCQDANGWSLLFYACEHQNLQIIRPTASESQPPRIPKCKKQRPVRHSSTRRNMWKRDDLLFNTRQVALDKVPDGFGDKGYGWPHLRGHPQASRETWMWLVVSIEKMAQDAVEKGDEVFRETSCWHHISIDTYIFVSSISIGAGAVFRFMFLAWFLSWLSWPPKYMRMAQSAACCILIADCPSWSVSWAESMFLRLGQPHRWLGARRRGLVNVEGLFNTPFPKKQKNVECGGWAVERKPTFV